MFCGWQHAKAQIICSNKLNIFRLDISVPDETLQKNRSKFSTRHSAAGILMHIDGTAVTAIGYMPQDIIGQSILDFFHPEDMYTIKHSYELLMKSAITDAHVSTAPYRFLIKKGCYITLVTQWTRVFNPWSRKLEFVTGDHCVSRGNLNLIISSIFFVISLWIRSFILIK